MRYAFPPRSSQSVAIRMAIPLVTCSRITECGPSATSGVNSTPRLMGPGAIIKISGLLRRIRS